LPALSKLTLTHIVLLKGLKYNSETASGIEVVADCFFSCDLHQEDGK
jgi:hypothetical protein